MSGSWMLFKAGFVWFPFAFAIFHFSFKISMFVVRFFSQCFFFFNFIINGMEFPQTTKNGIDFSPGNSTAGSIP